MHHFCAVPMYIILLFSVLFSSCLSVQLSCKNEANENVDWFVNYKLPKLERGYDGTDVAEGKAYSYILSSNPGEWKLSSNPITSTASMLAKTMRTFFDQKQNTTYLFYNDEPPPAYNGTANGHLKGVVVFNGETGFWIVHSIPKFSRIDLYEYPKNALNYGQSILCVTFKTAAINDICKQLLYCNPKIYEKQLTDEVKSFLDANTKSIFTKRPKFVRKPPFTRQIVLKSLDNEIFVSFAKDGQFKKDIYSAVIAPDLKVSIATETWRRGSGINLPPACSSAYTVTDINQIKMAAMSRNSLQNISFSSKDDHSKWAVSQNSTQSWICVGDMNRMESQERRGGGALCFQSKPVGKAYRTLIADSDQCPL